MSERRKPGTPAQLMLLLALSVSATFIARGFYSAPLPLHYEWSKHVLTAASEKGMRTVTVDEAKIMADTFSHIILDARKTSDFNAGRIPGAMSLPVSDFDAHIASISVLLTPEQPIMVYCSGQECEESLELGNILIASGYTNIALFAGGITEWAAAGHPVER